MTTVAEETTAVLQTERQSSATNFDILRRLNRLRKRSFWETNRSRLVIRWKLQFLDNRVVGYYHEESPC